MKTYITTLMKTLTLASCLILGINQQANAQCNPERRAHLIVDWQMNAPLNTDFADKISGWGMNFEGLYDITPRLSAGAFVSFHTNHQYVGRRHYNFRQPKALRPTSNGRPSSCLSEPPSTTHSAHTRKCAPM